MEYKIPSKPGTSPLDEQVGGDHYKHFPIQPIVFITQNKLGFIPGCIVKRICRYNRPGGKGVEDLKKIIHEVEILIQLQEEQDET